MINLSKKRSIEFRQLNQGPSTRYRNNDWGPSFFPEQMEKILSYFDIANQEGAQLLIGGEQNTLRGRTFKAGYYIKPTVYQRSITKCAFSKKKSLVQSYLSQHSKTPEEALEIANDTLYGLGAGVWSRDY